MLTYFKCSILQANNPGYPLILCFCSYEVVLIFISRIKCLEINLAWALQNLHCVVNKLTAWVIFSSNKYNVKSALLNINKWKTENSLNGEPNLKSQYLILYSKNVWNKDAHFFGKCNAMHSGKFKRQQNDNYIVCMCWKFLGTQDKMAKLSNQGER